MQAKIHIGGHGRVTSIYHSLRSNFKCIRQRFFGEALRETHGTHLDQRKIVIENAMAPFHLISTHHPPSSCYG